MATEGVSLRAIAEQTGVSAATAMRIVRAAYVAAKSKRRTDTESRQPV